MSAKDLREGRAQEIESQGTPASTPCDLCKQTGHSCIFWVQGIKGNQKLKCAHCVQRAKECVDGHPRKAGSKPFEVQIITRKTQQGKDKGEGSEDEDEVRKQSPPSP